MNRLRLSNSHATRPQPLRPTTARPVVRLTDAALTVMTDFTHEYPITVAESRRIDDALEDMICFGVRALVVVRGNEVAGLITSYDIQGERPLSFLQSTTYTRHDELRVVHVMTPWEQLPVLHFEDLRGAHVADVLEVFQASEQTHLVVVERQLGDAWGLRGLLSRTQLDRQLSGSE